MNYRARELLAGIALLAASVTCLLTGHGDAAFCFGLVGIVVLL